MEPSATDAPERKHAPNRKPASKMASRRARKHVIGALLSLIIGTASGFPIVYFFGEWLPPAEPHIIAGTGRIEEIRMPEGARKKVDVRKFIIAGGDADDFGRIYINNYLVNSGESPTKLFNSTNPAGTSARSDAIKYAVIRNDFMIEDKDVTVFLRRGDNYVVRELENSIFGTCVGGIRIEVNGATLEHFPQTMPDNFYVEPGVSNSVLAQKFEQAGIGALSDAVCARRIYHFRLE
ncbi:hypothetical protein [Rhizobium jaguaris]|uniref:Uncharacterized protein n=1 Tax=Rhizobium jaguaris TaxID=1312183 RepID=A0A387FT55_9HYPH|nr:hypothetical protein [Rhizobium jaguaris]AYG60575.1 hypothetical protein CCGE525_18475 [Rhizobium jaguaris]